MRKSIAAKLILAFLAVSLLSLVIVGVLTRTLTNAAFQRYLTAQDQTRVIELFTAYYENNGSWDGVRESIDRRYLGMVPFRLLDINNKIVYGGPGNQESPGNQNNAEHDQEPILIKANGEVVGYLQMSENYGTRRPTSDAFLERLDQIYQYSLIGTAGFALVLGWLLSRYLTRPIRELTAATRAVADGDLEQTVPVRSADELGQLAGSFNQMNQQLARSRDLRRQMTADIAHELRTPLSVILGHADGIHDGVLPLSVETVDIIRDEATRLERLIDDLRTLSLSDAGELSLDKENLIPQKLLQDARLLFNPRAQKKNIQLNVNTGEDLPEIYADHARMLQVLGNLVENALRYTPDNGEIELSAQKIENTIQLSVRDSGKGLRPEQAAHIFDRFYRADPSRQRDGSGSGLGLAISKSIVEGHGGRIWAESKEGEGLTVNIVLPTA